jgi:hypothetical protein
MTCQAGNVGVAFARAVVHSAISSQVHEGPNLARNPSSFPSQSARGLAAVHATPAGVFIGCALSENIQRSPIQIAWRVPNRRRKKERNPGSYLGGADTQARMLPIRTGCLQFQSRAIGPGNKRRIDRKVSFSSFGLWSRRSRRLEDYAPLQRRHSIDARLQLVGDTNGQRLGARVEVGHGPRPTKGQHRFFV